MSEKSEPGRAAAAIALSASLLAAPPVGVVDQRRAGLQAQEQPHALHIPDLAEVPEAIRALVAAQIMLGSIGAFGASFSSARVMATG
jgi:hypothetical protein